MNGVNIIIPAYNSERTIGECLSAATNLSWSGDLGIIIAVDDGSADKTSKVVRITGVIIFRLEKNHRKGVILNEILDVAWEMDINILVLLNDNFKHDSDEVPHLLGALQDEQCDIMMGSRFIESYHRISAYQKLGQKILTCFPNYSSSVRLTDSQSGHRLLSKKALQFLHFRENSFGAKPEMQFLVAKHGLAMKEVLITLDYTNRVRHSLVSYRVEILTKVINLIIEKYPLLFFDLAGLVLFLVGVSIDLYVLQIAINARTLHTGFALISSFSFCTFGRLMFFNRIKLEYDKGYGY